MSSTRAESIRAVTRDLNQSGYEVQQHVGEFTKSTTETKVGGEQRLVEEKREVLEVKLKHKETGDTVVIRIESSNISELTLDKHDKSQELKDKTSLPSITRQSKKLVVERRTTRLGSSSAGTEPSKSEGSIGHRISVDFVPAASPKSEAGPLRAETPDRSDLDWKSDPFRLSDVYERSGNPITVGPSALGGHTSREQPRPRSSGSVARLVESQSLAVAGAIGMVTAYANLATFGASVGVTGGLAVASALSGGVVLVVLGAITVGLEIADEGADAERILSAMRSFKKGIDYTSGKWSFVGALASDLNRHVTSDGDNHETAILGTVAAFRAVEVAKRAGDIGKFDSRYRAIVGGAYSLKLINDAVRLPFKLCEVESSNSPLH